MRERVSLATLLLQLTPEPDEDIELVEFHGRSRFLREHKPVFLETAGLAFRELARFPIGTVLELYETCFPQLQKLAMG